ncbi:PepSY-associated TM helix domain-containing protein [Zoogloea sp.]|uniref:PepSY-associated TM helix domain-containing protein n=1 Tax=Zoogloea sp. TaxID=49181 RepID=UPI001AC48133|nr:PepSY-associated TM helix domain-containing protein [Zoogloea sp.]MBN8285333.1 PepSY domain-containing protein [Zoogloea sp.]
MRREKKRKPWTMRRIHTWIAIILVLPMVLVAVSGILISMRSISDVKVPLRWMGAESVPERLPMSAFVTDGQVAWIGNAQGLTRIEAGQALAVDAFAGQEIVGLALLKGVGTPVVATRMAIWHAVGGRWMPVQRGRVRQLSTLPDGRGFVIVGGRGEMADGRPLVSADGRDWQPWDVALAANHSLPPLVDPKVALHQWMRELHAGAYFFGKGPGEMLWSNVLGWVLVALCLTGLWIWLKTEQAKLKSLQRKLREAGKEN